MESNDQVQHFRVVRQEHLNQYGSIFGGYLLQTIDEMAFVACVRRWPGRNFVTRAMNDIEFRAPARLGDVLETRCHVEKVGRTSVHVHAQVYIRQSRSSRQSLSFDGTVIMVCVDDRGDAMPIESNVETGNDSQSS